MASFDNVPTQESNYHIERLDDVRERLSHMEGRMESFATKEDVANAKLAVILLWVGAAVMVLSAVVSALIRFWPG